MHLGIPRLSAFLVEDGALIIVTSTIVPVAMCQPLRRQMPLHLVEQLTAQIVRFQQVAEAAHRGLVRHRLAAKIDLTKLRIASRS